MKINSEIFLNDVDKRCLEFCLRTFCELHKEYHNINSCDDLVSLAFDIGREYSFFSSNLVNSIDTKTYKRFIGLYFHLRGMCERKAFKIFNQG